MTDVTGDPNDEDKDNLRLMENLSQQKGYLKFVVQFLQFVGFKKYHIMIFEQKQANKPTRPGVFHFSLKNNFIE